MKWTAARIAGFAADAGFDPGVLQTATALALAVSGGDDRWGYRLDPGPITDQRGLWGIDVVKFPGSLPDDLYRPDVNARWAQSLYTAAGRSFGWSPVDWRTIDPETWHAAERAARNPSRVQSAANLRSRQGPDVIRDAIATITEKASDALTGTFPFGR